MLSLHINQVWHKLRAMSLKNNLLLISGILILFCSSIFAESISPQQFAVTSNKGIIEIWSKEKSSWTSLNDVTLIKAGHTIATRDSAEIQFTFEPAIIITLKENSIITLNNLIVNKVNKMIRMSLMMQSGNLSLQMPVSSGYTLLYSLETPSASVQFNNADVIIHVEKDITTLQVQRGEAKVKHASVEIKSVVFAGCKATIFPDKPVVEITGLHDQPVAKKPASSEPSIAILSIQSDKKNDASVEKISDIVAEHYQNKSNAKVLYLDDIRELLRTENVESLLRCFSDSCISKIGALAGVDLLILGSVGQLGQSYLFSLKMVDVLRDKTLKRVTASVENDIGLILGKIPQMVDEMVTIQKSVENPLQVRPVSDSTAAFNESIIWIQGGTFEMGIVSNAEDFDALPKHKVTVKGFYMDKYEVTKEDYERVMGNNPSAFRGCSKCPADNVTWFEADEYCRKIGKRLPTEAEWEYACRAGTSSNFHYGNTLSSSQANFDGNHPYGGVPIGQFRTRPVTIGQYDPNGWGLHDMHGNVAEWCSDWYDAAYYGNSSPENPQGPADGKLKVVRGGSWNGKAAMLRSGKRTGYNPSLRLNTIGFRCVKDDYEKSKN